MCLISNPKSHTWVISDPNCSQLWKNIHLHHLQLFHALVLIRVNTVWKSLFLSYPKCQYYKYWKINALFHISNCLILVTWSILQFPCSTVHILFLAVLPAQYKDSIVPFYKVWEIIPLVVHVHVLVSSIHSALNEAPR